jgi:hypothetical protein
MEGEISGIESLHVGSQPVHLLVGNDICSKNYRHVNCESAFNKLLSNTYLPYVDIDAAICIRSSAPNSPKVADIKAIVEGRELPN